MKRKGVDKSRCKVEIDAEQMEYLRYYHRLTGQPIANILRDMIAQWVAVEYATRVPTVEKPNQDTKKRAKMRLATKKS
jgi:hypothetical protein